ncbi:MAG TPA: hypothetical protein VEZ47_07690 [Gemmatirosa sp.]|nr:hypothetical protein [Gemmatirosa sp.]
MPENIDAFNRTAAAVFAHLYEQFPAGTTLMPPLPGTPEWSDGAAARFTDTVDFLIREGFLYVDPKRVIRNKLGRASYFDAVLTAKGLALLSVPSAPADGAAPETPETPVPVGQRLRSALAGSRDTVNTVVAQVIAAATFGRVPPP